MLHRQDTQLFAVLGHCPSCDPDVFIGQYLGDRIVGERLLGVFFFYHILDVLPDAFRCQIIAALLVDGGGEKVL